MRRGEIYRVHRPNDDPKRFRCYVVVSRQILIDSKFPSVICAPIFSRGHGSSTQGHLGLAEGMKHESWVLGDNLVSVLKTDLTRSVGSFSGPKIEELDRALRMALALQ